MALMEITTIPVGTGSTSVGDYVLAIHRLLEEQGVGYELTDMGSIVEGPVEELLALARRIHESPFRHGVKRVYTVLRIDDRRDREVHLGDKTRSIRERLAR